MRLVLKSLLWRPLLRKPWRFVLTVAGVAVGVASVLATLLASRAAIASFKEGVEEIAGASRLEILQPGGVPEEMLGRLREACEIAVIAPVVEDRVQVPGIEDTVRLLGIDVLVDARVREFLEASTASWSTASLRFLGGEGAVLPSTLARELGIGKGDQAELWIQARKVKLEVLGEFDPGPAPKALHRVAVVDVALAQELLGRVGRLDRIELVPRKGVSLDELRQRVEPLLSKSQKLAPPTVRAADQHAAVRSLEFNLTALAGVSLVVAAALVATTLATSVVQRRPTLSLLVTLGASRGQIRGAVLLEAVAIGVIGSLLGVAGGWLGARLALRSVRATVSAVISGLPGTEISLDPTLAVLCFLLGTLVSVAAAMLPLSVALRTPPIQHLRAEVPGLLSRRSWWLAVASVLGTLAVAATLTAMPPLGDLPVAALSAAFVILGAQWLATGPGLDLIARGIAKVGHATSVTLRLAAAGLVTGRGRVSWAAAAVGVALSLAVSMTTMIDSFRGSVVAWVRHTLHSDLWVQPSSRGPSGPSGSLPPRVAELAREMFGPDNVDAYHSTAGVAGGQRVSLGGSDLGVVSRHSGGVPFVDGRSTPEVYEETVRRGGVVVSESFARRLKVSAGDTVELEVPTGVIQRRVEGVFRDYSNPRGTAIMDRSDFLQHFPDEGPRRLAIYLKPGADPALERARLLEQIGAGYALMVMVQSEQRARVLALFERTFAVTTALRIVAAVVALIAVITVLGALVVERRQDFAVLRAVGGSPTQVAGVVLLESVALATLAAITGAAFGIAVGWVLVAVVNVQSFGWTLDFAVPWVEVATLGLAVVPAAIGAALLPARRAARTDLSEALHQEA